MEDKVIRINICFSEEQNELGEDLVRKTVAYAISQFKGPAAHKKNEGHALVFHRDEDEAINLQIVPKEESS